MSDFERDWNNMVQGLSSHARILKHPIDDPETNRLIERTRKVEVLLKDLRNKFPQCVPSYFYTQYEPLKTKNKKQLEKILFTLLNRIFDILFRLGIQPYTHPYLFTKGYPRKPTEYPYSNSPFLKYYYKNIAPFQIVGSVLSPHLPYVNLDQFDEEHLRFIAHNIQFLSQIPVLHLEWSLENKKIRNEDLIRTIRKDVSRNPKVSPQEKKEIQDEIFRYELCHKPVTQKLQLQKLYQQFYEVMEQKKQDEERQQEQILCDGLRRRKELEKLRKGRSIKRKETLGKSGAEALIEYHQKKRKKMSA